MTETKEYTTYRKTVYALGFPRAPIKHRTKSRVICGAVLHARLIRQPNQLHVLENISGLSTITARAKAVKWRAI